MTNLSNNIFANDWQIIVEVLPADPAASSTGKKLLLSIGRLCVFRKQSLIYRLQRKKDLLKSHCV
jgi:hypothetical protein